MRVTSEQGNNRVSVFMARWMRVVDLMSVNGKTAQGKKDSAF